MNAKLVKLILAHGFTRKSDIFVHPDGHVLMVKDWDFAVRWSDGTFSQCRSSAFASYYNMEPEALGCKALQQHFDTRGIKPSAKRTLNRRKK